MPEYDNDMRGQIWKNDRKERETQPDFTGSAEIGGTKYWVSAWRRKPDANPKAPALSFSFKPKDDLPGQTLGEPKGTDMAAINVDEDVPF